MSAYVVHALLGVDEHGNTQEISGEADDWDGAMDRAKWVADTNPSFMAITIMHVEEHPRFVEGATQQ